MSATEQRTERLEVPAARRALGRADGIELLGDVHGSGYKEGAALVRRADGQIVQLGPLMYALLEEIDGTRTNDDLAAALCDKLGRDCTAEHVQKLADKLAAQGLLAGTEQNAPPRRNPLLALRWKVLVTNPRTTRLLTAPFTLLYNPFVLVPVVAAFVAVLWFVLVHHGVAAATAEAFHRPGLLLLVLGLGIVSAGFHEIGHAAACRYAGATPGGMGVGLYLVWPAFYTDVTDAYRLPKRDRLRVDLGGIYFNAVVSVLTVGVWLAWRHDALLLLVALQLLMIVKNLSPVIRSDGYHILSDLTGVPDLYAHIGPTMKRLVPWHRREPSALTGRARAIVTLWVLIVVPVLLSLLFGAIILLPRLLTTAWDGERAEISSISHKGALGIAASVVRMIAIALPLLGSLLITQRLVRSSIAKADSWSSGRPVRQGALAVVTAAAFAGFAWAWWPSGQYQPVQAADRGTLVSFTHALASPASVARPKPHPALFVIEGATPDDPAVAILSSSSPDPSATDATTTQQASPSAAPTTATAFTFAMPSKPRAGDSQALAVNTSTGGVKYDVVYSLVTVKNGAPVTNQNSAYAFANCVSCTTVAVSFQVVLVVGQSNLIAPINVAAAENGNCIACMTTAIADQMVITLSKQPTQQLVDQITTALKQLDAVQALGASATPAAIAAQVQAVQQEIQTAIDQSGLAVSTTAAQATTTAAATTSTTARTTTTSSTTTQSTTTATTARTTTAQTTTAATSTSSTTEPATTTSPATTTAATTTTTSG